MKKKTIDTERRKFFAKFGLGAISAGIMNILPLKAFSAAAQYNKSEQKISIAIDPMAVKRIKKG